MRSILALLLLPAVLLSCKKEASLPEYNADPVVTAYLNPGAAFRLQLSHQQATSSTVFSSPSLDSLDITITCNDTVYHLTGQGDGSYTHPGLIIKAGNQYDLSFTYNGKIVSASTKIPAKPVNFAQSVTEISLEQVTATSSTAGSPGSFPDPVTLTWDNTDASYYLVVVQNIDSASTLAPIIDTGTVDTTRIFRNRPSTAASTEINSRTFTYFGKHRIVLFHINPDYAFLYDRSSSSSQNLSTPSTGISNGVGIFTGISSDTLYLQVNKQ